MLEIGCPWPSGLECVGGGCPEGSRSGLQEPTLLQSPQPARQEVGVTRAVQVQGAGPTRWPGRGEKAQVSLWEARQQVQWRAGPESQELSGSFVPVNLSKATIFATQASRPKRDLTHLPPGDQRSWRRCVLGRRCLPPKAHLPGAGSLTVVSHWRRTWLVRAHGTVLLFPMCPSPPVPLWWGLEQCSSNIQVHPSHRDTPARWVWTRAGVHV